MKRSYPLTAHQIELLAEKAKRAGANLESLRKVHDARNAEIMSQWAKVAPGADAAVLEVTIRASGQPRRRLLRRLQYGWRRGERGWIQYRASHPFEWLTYHTVEAAVLALASDTELVTWRLVGEPIEWSDPAPLP